MKSQNATLTPATDILYARYLESCVDRLNHELRVIRCLLPEDDLTVLESGRVVNKSCGGLVAVLIEMKETARALKAGEQADDTDNRYEPRMRVIDANIPENWSMGGTSPQRPPIGEYRR